MSRIGRKIINIPQGVEVVLDGQKASVKGPKGALSFEAPAIFSVKKEGDAISIAPLQNQEELEKPVKALWGTTRQLFSNMIEGVTKGFEKKLEIEGVGYKANVEGDVLALSVGFTVPFKMKIPEGVKVQVDKNTIIVSGIDKAKVGQFAASVRARRKVEPYKGKGIKYQGEQVRKKLGKKAAAATGAAGGPAK